MTREHIRALVEVVTGLPCPADDEPVVMSSLQELEFVFAIEDDINFRHPLPDDVKWRTVNDVVNWLEEKGELTSSTGIHTK